MTFAAIAAAQLPVPSRIAPGPARRRSTSGSSKALERDPNKRFQTAKELADELAKALDAPPISLVNVSSPSQIELEALAGSDGDRVAERRRRRARPRQRGSRRQRRRPTDVGRPRASRSISSAPQRAPERDRSAAHGGPRGAAPRRRPRRGRGRCFARALRGARGGVGGGGAGSSTRKVLHPRRPRAASPRRRRSPRRPPRAAPRTPRRCPAAARAAEVDGHDRGGPAAARRRATPTARCASSRTPSDAGGGARREVVPRSGEARRRRRPGPCKMAAFSHPRLGYGGQPRAARRRGRRPRAPSSRGPTITSSRATTTSTRSLIDAAGRPTSRARDLTPEADYAMRPAAAHASDDRVVLLFWDKSGREPGVHVRWLDADGRIGGMSALVGAGEARALLAGDGPRARRNASGSPGRRAPTRKATTSSSATSTPTSSRSAPRSARPTTSPTRASRRA